MKTDSSSSSSSILVIEWAVEKSTYDNNRPILTAPCEHASTLTLVNANITIGSNSLSPSQGLNALRMGKSFQGTSVGFLMRRKHCSSPIIFSLPAWRLKVATLFSSYPTAFFSYTHQLTAVIYHYCKQRGNTHSLFVHIMMKLALNRDWNASQGSRCPFKTLLHADAAQGWKLRILHLRN